MTKLQVTMDEISMLITNIAINPSQVLQAFYSNRTGVNAVSHTIFQIYPTDKLRQMGQRKCGAVSQWVFRSLMNTCETHDANMAARFYRELSADRFAAFAGHLFERSTLKELG